MARLSRPCQWFSLDIVADYQAALVRTCAPMKTWDQRIAPLLLLNGEWYREERKRWSLLVLTNDGRYPVHTGAANMHFQLLQVHDSLMKQTAALSCPLAFGSGQVHTNMQTLDGVRSAMAVDPFALRAARAFFIKMKLADLSSSDSTGETKQARVQRPRFDHAKLLLLDAYSGTGLAERQSAVHQELVQRDLTEVRAPPDDAGEQMRAYKNRVIQINALHDGLPQAMEKVIREALRTDVRCTALSETMFQHLVNWGFARVAVAFADQGPLSRNVQLARQVPFPHLVPSFLKCDYSRT